MKRILNIKTLALAVILLMGNMPVGAAERQHLRRGPTQFYHWSLRADGCWQDRLLRNISREGAK